jgi:hypothetical protein
VVCALCVRYECASGFLTCTVMLVCDICTRDSAERAGASLNLTGSLGELLKCLPGGSTQREDTVRAAVAQLTGEPFVSRSDEVRTSGMRPRACHYHQRVTVLCAFLLSPYLFKRGERCDPSSLRVGRHS